MIDPPAEQTMLSTPTATVGGSRFRFVVHGLPVPQGSKSCRCHEGRGILFDANASELKRWRKLVTREARDAYAAAGHRGTFDGPLALTAEFRHPMPASRRAVDKSMGRIWKQSAPDLDKLVRALGDSLADAKVIRDDARIVRQVVCKTEVWKLWTGVDVTVEQLWGHP